MRVASLSAVLNIVHGRPFGASSGRIAGAFA